MKLPKNAERFSISKLLALLFSFLFIISVSSCTQQQSAPAELPPDEDITETIQTQFNASERVPEDSVNIDTEDGIVTLSGTTSNLLAKREATQIAEATYGVLSVVNNLKVTTSRSDQAVDQDVDRALATDPATESWEIASSVNNGVVTLKGAVDSWQEAQLAATVASSVKGVKAITNDIIINYDGSRSDEQIKSEIETRLKMNANVDANMVNVNVSEGDVTLTGAIGSAEEKSLAKDLAQVTGVESVAADELEVKPTFESEMFVNSEIQALTNRQITKAIQSAFRYDPRVPADSITIEMDGGTAILEGSVLNLNSKLAAQSDALNTAGVDQIQNDITVQRKVVVKPEIPTTDAAMAQRLRYALDRDPYVERTGLKVEVNNAVATITGRLDSQFEKERTTEIAQDIKGLISVENNINVPS